MKPNSGFLFHLATLPGMGPVSFRRLQSRFDSLDAVLMATPDELVLEAGVGRDLADTILRSGDTLDDTLETLDLFDSTGIQNVYSEEKDLPFRLARAPEEWHWLSGLGKISLLDEERVVAVVGRRRASEIGLQLAHELGAALADRGVATVSGMARGIDRAAHLGSLSQGGGTIGLLPMGILRFLQENRQFPKAAEEGQSSPLLLISGAPPNQNWSTAEAMRRNKWIAGWSDAVVVVEAGEKGGTWRTAENAVKRGKPLWVVTGFREEEAGVGNEYLADKLAANRLDVSESAEEWAERILTSIQPND